MTGHDPKHREPHGSDPLFSAEARAALRRELGPDHEARARVRAALWSNVAAGTASPVAQRVDGLLHAKGSAAAAKAAATSSVKAALSASVHSITGKLVLVGVLAGGGTAAVVLRGASPPERPAVVAPTVVAPPQDVAPALPSYETRAQPPRRDDDASRTTADTKAESTPAQRAGDAPSQPRAAASNTRGRRHQPRAAHELGADARPGREPSASQALQHDATAVEPVRAPDERVEHAATAAETETSKVAPAPSHKLGAELALVRAASDALRVRDTSAALQQLQQHAAQFPHGALRVEAEALRSIALCTANAHDSAAVSRRFLEAHPDGALAERVRRACHQP